MYLQSAPYSYFGAAATIAWNPTLEPLDAKISKYAGGEPIRLDGKPRASGILDTVSFSPPAYDAETDSGSGARCNRERNQDTGGATRQSRHGSIGELCQASTAAHANRTPGESGCRRVVFRV